MAQHLTRKAVLKLNVTNHGLSDQIHDDIKVRIHNNNFLLRQSQDGSNYKNHVALPQSIVQKDLMFSIAQMDKQPQQFAFEDVFASEKGQMLQQVSNSTNAPKKQNMTNDFAPEHNQLLDLDLDEQIEEQKRTLDPKLTNEFQINGLKARESRIVEIPVFLKDPKALPGFYKNFDGVIETTVQYYEFATSTTPKNQVLVFPEIKK